MSDVSTSGHGAPVRVTFHRRLDDLDDAFVGAALVVAEAMPRLVRRFLAGDATSVTEARTMAEDVADRIRDVENRGFVMIARESPVGRDLRRLVAILRVAVNVERSAALLRHVNETLVRFDPKTLPAGPRDALEDMAVRATEVFGLGIDAWRQRDADAVEALDRKDEAIDHLQEQLVEAGFDEGTGDVGVVLGLLARYFERIADHGVALAQDVAFVVSGERVSLPSKR